MKHTASVLIGKLVLVPILAAVLGGCLDEGMASFASFQVGDSFEYVWAGGDVGASGGSAKVPDDDSDPLVFRYMFHAEVDIFTGPGVAHRVTPVSVRESADDAQPVRIMHLDAADGRLVGVALAGSDGTWRWVPKAVRVPLPTMGGIDRATLADHVVFPPVSVPDYPYGPNTSRQFQDTVEMLRLDRTETSYLVSHRHIAWELDVVEQTQVSWRHADPLPYEIKALDDEGATMILRGWEHGDADVVGLQLDPLTDSWLGEAGWSGSLMPGTLSQDTPEEVWAFLVSKPELWLPLDAPSSTEILWYHVGIDYDDAERWGQWDLEVLREDGTSQCVRYVEREQRENLLYRGSKLDCGPFPGRFGIPGAPNPFHPDESFVTWSSLGSWIDANCDQKLLSFGASFGGDAGASVSFLSRAEEEGGRLGAAFYAGLSLDLPTGHLIGVSQVVPGEVPCPGTLPPVLAGVVPWFDDLPTEWE